MADILQQIKQEEEDSVLEVQSSSSSNNGCSSSEDDLDSPRYQKNIQRNQNDS